MANYSLIINSKFKPFSYQELLQPALMSTQAHQAVEDAYSELATKANIWDKMTDPGSKAHGMYEAYARDLEQQAEQLSRYGLTPSSRQHMLNMKSRYSSDIVPIEQAYKRREEQIAEQRKAGNSMIYDYDAQTTSLDRFIENPALSYRSIDRRDLYTRAVNDFGQYAKALSDYGNGKRLDNFTKTFVQDYGITPEQARDFITAMRTGNLDIANPTLRNVYDALYDSTGVRDWNNTQAQQTVSNTILEGVGAAIGKSAVSPYEDKGAVMAQQLANQRALVNEQNEQAAQERMKMYDINPTTYYSSSEVAKANKKVSDNLKKYRDKGYFDAKGKLTDAGKKALNVQYKTYETADKDGMRIKMSRIVSGDADFANWAKSVRNSEFAAISHGQGGQHQYLENYYSRASKAIASGQLATGTANFNVYRQRLTGQDRNVLADNILTALGADGNIIKAGDLDNQGNIIGTEVSKKEFMEALGRDESGKGNSNINYIVNSPTTGKDGQQLIELTNGEKYILPAGILGIDTQANLGRANLNVRNSKSSAEVATNLNLGNSYLASMLTTTGGTEVKPNDGTITIDLNR